MFGPVRHNADGSIRWHRGFDYYAPKGTPIMAVGEGVISLIQENHPGYGLCILITHKRPKNILFVLCTSKFRLGEIWPESSERNCNRTKRNNW